MKPGAVTGRWHSARLLLQRFAFVMDTRLCENVYALADGVDMLVIEATFLDEDSALATEYGHLTARQAAERWEVSLRYAQRLLAAGKVPGGRKYGRSWILPLNTPKPSAAKRAWKPNNNAKPPPNSTRIVKGSIAPGTPIDSI